MSERLEKDWLPQVDASILTEDEIPLLGDAPPVSWDKISSHLAKLLGVQNVQLQSSEWIWRDKQDLLSGIGQNPKVLQFTLTPLNGKAYIVLSSQDLENLITNLMKTEAKDIPQEIQKAFIDFFAISLMKQLQEEEAFKNVQMRLLDDEKLPDELSLTMDLNVQSIHARLYLSKELRSAWKRHHEKELIYKRITSPIPLNLSVWSGHVTLSLSEYKTVKEGDFVILDQMLFDPSSHTGGIYLSYGRTVLFHGDVSHNKIKITDHRPKTQEPSMSKNPSDLPPDESFFLGEDEEFFLEDEELSKVLKEEIKQEPQPQTLAKEEKSKIAKASNAQEENSHLNAEELPIHIKIEMAHITLTAQELLELRPGNEISLEKEIDNRVNLVVGGRCVGKAELIRFGETLGIRILQI